MVHNKANAEIRFSKKSSLLLASEQRNSSIYR